MNNQKKAAVSAGQTTTAHFSGVSTTACKIDTPILFETAKSFIPFKYKPVIERAFAFGLTNSSTGPVPKPNQFLLILGHADQVGKKKSNIELSERRARAAYAVFTIDSSIWESLYIDEKWGVAEIEAMSVVVDTEGSSDLINRYLTDSYARAELMLHYLKALRPDWLPKTSPPINPAAVTLKDKSEPLIGCGEELPIKNAPNTAVKENRRAEFLYFKKANLDISSYPSPDVYSSWKATCSQFFTVEISIQNEYGDPYNGNFELTLPTGGVLNSEQTNNKGIWTRKNLPPGKYKIVVNGWEISELPSGTISKPIFEKNLTALNNKINIQVIFLDRWFIPRVNPLSRIPQYSRGNNVDILIDGQAMMAAIHNAIISTTAADHYIYITGWRMDTAVLLLGPATPASGVIAVLIAAIGRNVEVRAMLWDAHGTQNTNEQEAIDDADRTPHRGQAILDNWTLVHGSHHQKSAVVRTASELIAFCGGIDLALGRFDTPAHAGQNPWHDVHTRIRGPAAADIETNFRERWNNHPDRNDNGRTNVPGIPPHSVPSEIPTGSHLVQTLRTFPPSMSYPFTIGGELGILNAYLRAIPNAREYIYIEDQYLVSEEIQRAIARVLGALRGRFIAVINRQPEDPWPAPDAIFHHRLVDFIQRLEAIDRTKIEVYHLTNRATGNNIFVHAKVMIIDDIWASIGSANVNRRSMTHDSEINIAVIDGAVEKGRRKFARTLRKRLWAEHLGVNQSMLEDPVKSIGLWRTRAASTGSHIAVYDRPAGSDSIHWNNTIDPDGR